MRRPRARRSRVQSARTVCLTALATLPPRARATRRSGALAASPRPSERPRRRDDIDPALLPSREAILDALKQAGVPLPPSELARAMAVDKRAREAFFGRIDAMQRDGQLLMNRKGELCVTAKLDLITGTVQGHPDGFGFLVPDDGSADLFLRPSEMHKVLHGDRATARRTGTDRRGRPEGEIVDVLARANRTVVGRLLRGARHQLRRRREPAHQPGPAGAGGRARRRESRATSSSSRSSQQPSPQREAIARVVEVLGGYTDPGHGDRDRAAQARSAARVLARGAQAGGQAARRRSPTAIARAASTSRRCRSSPSTARPRRTSTTPCTARASATGFRLIVAIADVSHYVKDGDALDRDARERGTSVYFPRRVIPMLPEALSNELCSLKPQVDRLCMVCEMEITADGAIAQAQVLSGGDALARAAHLHAGVELAVAIRRARRARRSRCCRTSPISTRCSTR